MRNLKRCLEIIYTKLNLYRLMKPDINLFESSLDLNQKIQFPIKLNNKLVDKLMKDGIKAYFVQLTDKDPNELGFNKVWDVIHSTNQTTFSDFIKHRLYG